MAEPTSGLRFDIYERVQLSEEIEGIEQLDEIEIIPQVQIESRNDQAVLKGNLLLTGTYVGGQDTRKTNPLEHQIPVEITLPMNRVQDIEQIGVEIENFDIDLHSPRSLNVTGVLSLQGVNLNTTPAEEWRDEEDEFVVIHQANSLGNHDTVDNKSNDLKETGKSVQAAERPSSKPLKEKSSVSSTEEQFDEIQYVDEELNSPIVEKAESESSVQTDLSEEQSSDDIFALDNEEAPEEETELKIAFNSKKMDAETNEFVPKQMTSLLHNDISRETTAIEPEINSNEATEQSDPSHEVMTANEKESSTPDSEWKSLFLNHEEDEPQFKKVRMCIIQKEETIETIAQRYNLNSREILLYNRLDEQEVSEGQIIYIPN